MDIDFQELTMAAFEGPSARFSVLKTAMRNTVRKQMSKERGQV